jgi:hypothetical protein
MKLLALLMLTFCLSAAPNQIENGFLNYGNETVNSLQVNGYVNLNGTTITNLLQVNGSLTATQAQIGEMNVQGQASLNNCTVKNKSMVAGSLTALLSSFNDEVTLLSDNSAFDTCSIASIRVRKSQNNVPQIIELKGKSKVTGPITFESGSGQVIASPESQISPASVIGGMLKKS